MEYVVGIVSGNFAGKQVKKSGVVDGKGIRDRLRKSVVGVMGLGGLGSAVAVALARAGVGRLLLADFDVVESANLQRQQYFFDQIGLPKTTALEANLVRIDPDLAVELIQERLNQERIVRLSGRVDVLVECFDQAEMKALGLRVAMKDLAGIAYVGASGVAGCDENNLIRTRKLCKGIYLVGDGKAAVRPEMKLMAPRVGIAAHHQANQVIRLLLGKE